MRSLESLPTEILLRICEFLYRRDLAALRRVSKFTVPAATKVLFTGAEFHFDGSALPRVLERPHLRRYLRNLSFVGEETWGRVVMETRRYDRADEATSCALVADLALHDIKLHGIRVGNDLRTFLAIIHVASKYGITALRRIVISPGTLVCVGKSGDEDEMPGPEIVAQAAKVLVGIEELVAPFAFASLATGLIESMRNLRSIVLDGSNSYPMNVESWKTLLPAVDGKLLLSKLRNLTLINQLLFPYMLKSPAIHAPNVTDITLLYVDLGPELWFTALTKEAPWEGGQAKWMRTRWQDFIDTFVENYAGSGKRLTVGGLKEERGLVSVRSKDQRVVRVLPRSETLERISELRQK